MNFWGKYNKRVENETLPKARFFHFLSCKPTEQDTKKETFPTKSYASRHKIQRNIQVQKLFDKITFG